MAHRLMEAPGGQGSTEWLYQELRRQIESGEWPHNHALPSQIDLLRRYGLSMRTVRDVVGQLAEVGRVIKSQGRHTRVYMPDPRHRVVLERQRDRSVTGVTEPDRPFLSVVPAHNTGHTGYQWIEDDFTVPAWEAGGLGFDAGETVSRRVLNVSLGDEVVLTSSSFLPAGIIGRSGDWRLSALGDLAVTGLAVVYATTEVQVRIPTLAESELLDIVSGIPVIACYRRCTVFNASDPDVALPACVLVLARGDRVFLTI